MATNGTIATIPCLNFSEELPEVVRRELDQYTAKLRRYLLVSLNEDGTLRTAANNDNPPPTVVNNTFGPGDGIDQEQWWKKGPWTLDDPSATEKDIVALRPPSPPAGTYNDYAPPGIDSAVAIEIAPTGNITLNGIQKALNTRKRMLMFRNSSTTKTITLKHASTGSKLGNRFALPAATDVVLDPGQNIWLYYDLLQAAWSAAITTQKAGGFNVGSAGGGDVTGPAGATDNDVAVFNGATGKIIKDSGILITSLSGPSSGANIFQAEADLGTLETGLTSPATLVAAPGVRLVVVPHILEFIQSCSNDQFIQNAPITLTLKYSGITTPIVNTFQISNALNRYVYFRFGALDTNFGVGEGKPGPPASTVDPHNQSVILTTDKDISYTGGGGASKGKFRCALTYSIVAITNPVAT